MQRSNTNPNTFRQPNENRSIVKQNLIKTFPFLLTSYVLTDLDIRTVSYGPSFFPFELMAQARSARAINRRGKNEDPQLTVRG